MKSERKANFEAPSPAASGKDTLFDWHKNAGMTETVLLTMERSIARRRQAQAALVLVLALGAGLVWRGTSRDRTLVAATASPFVSAPARQALADGSTVDLKEGAEIFVDYGPSIRLVRVLRGEAYFDVAKDPSRDFVVQAAGVEVRAVGTQFAVGVGQTSVDVLVTEGRVRVRPATEAAQHAGAALSPGVLVDAGHQLSAPLFDGQKAESAELLSPDKIDERLTWRIPRLEFSGTPLQEAVGVINQHSKTRLTLADAELGAVRLSGSIRADNVEALLALLEADHGVVAERVGENQILLRRGH